MGSREGDQPHEKENPISQDGLSTFTRNSNITVVKSYLKTSSNPEVIRRIFERPPSNPMESLQTISSLLPDSPDMSARSRGKSWSYGKNKLFSPSNSPEQALMHRKKSKSPLTRVRKISSDEIPNSLYPGESVKPSKFYQFSRTSTRLSDEEVKKEIDLKIDEHVKKNSKNEIKELLKFCHENEKVHSDDKKHSQDLGIFGTFSIKEMKKYLAAKSE